MSIAFSTCFYAINSKFDPSTYVKWMGHLFSIIHQCKLVVYTDEASRVYINTHDNPNIIVVVKPLEQLYNYRYKEYWIDNHRNNSLLNGVSCWELNMLWAEKTAFVKETMEQRIFDTDYYGWCDIGYFRNRPNDTHTSLLTSWANEQVVRNIDRQTVMYGCINNDDAFLDELKQTVCRKNKDGLPVVPIPASQCSIAGGFFVAHRGVVQWWFHTFDATLERYFKHQYLVKDDQIIIADCVFSNIDMFTLVREHNPPMDNWFMFQRILK